MLGFDFSKMTNFKHFDCNYTIEGTLGSGGFANVYKVKSKLDNRNYALKVMQIKPRHLKVDVYEHLQRMLAETKVLSSLRHPNIVRYYGCWMQLEETDTTEEQESQREETQSQDSTFEIIMDEFDSSSQGIHFAGVSQRSNEQPQGVNVNKYNQQAKSNMHEQYLYKYKSIKIYILTELCEQNLHTFIYNRNTCVQKRQLTTEQCVLNYEMILNIIDGIDYLHGKKIIHRDIKLQNIIVSEHQRCKIIDYGLAKKVRMWNSIDEQPIDVISLVMDDNDKCMREKYSSSVGTKIYSSPEQASSEIYDHRTDIYSLGLVIAMMFSTFSTAHEQRQTLLQIRNKNLTNVQLQDSQIKQLLVRCLGEDKQRPTLHEIRKCIKQIMSKLKETNSKNQGNSIIRKGKFQYHMFDDQLIKRVLISPQ